MTDPEFIVRCDAGAWLVSINSSLSLHLPSIGARFHKWYVDVVRSCSSSDLFIEFQRDSGSSLRCQAWSGACVSSLLCVVRHRVCVAVSLRWLLGGVCVCFVGQVRGACGCVPHGGQGLAPAPVAAQRKHLRGTDLAYELPVPSGTGWFNLSEAPQRAVGRGTTV